MQQGHIEVEPSAAQLLAELVVQGLGDAAAGLSRSCSIRRRVTARRGPAAAGGVGLLVLLALG